MAIPGKVQSYMAAGKPIIGSINGSYSNFIKNNKVEKCNNALINQIIDMVPNYINHFKFNIDIVK